MVQEQQHLSILSIRLPGKTNCPLISESLARAAAFYLAAELPEVEDNEG
jgi:hypothetical protein